MFLLGAQTTRLEVLGSESVSGNVDAAGWTLGSTILVSILYLESTSSDPNTEVEVVLPAKAASTARITQVLYGNGGWDVLSQSQDEASLRLVKKGLDGLEVDLLVVEL